MDLEAISCCERSSSEPTFLLVASHTVVCWQLSALDVLLHDAFELVAALHRRGCYLAFPREPVLQIEQIPRAACRLLGNLSALAVGRLSRRIPAGLSSSIWLLLASRRLLACNFLQVADIEHFRHTELVPVFFDAPPKPAPVPPARRRLRQLFEVMLMVGVLVSIGIISILL